MPLPSSSSIDTLDFALDGTSALYLTTEQSVSTETLDYAFDGSAFVVDPNILYVSITPEADIVSTDSDSLYLDVEIQELIRGLDDLITNFVTLAELIHILDLVSPVIPVVYQELVNGHDDVIAIPVVIVIPIEYINGYDSTALSDITQIDTGTLEIQVGQYLAESGDLIIEIGTYAKEEISYTVGVAANTLPPVTNIASVSNPYQPTVAIGGSYIVQNTSTDPGGTAVAATNIYIHWLSAGVDGNQWTDLFNFSFELDYYGGHWNVTSRNPINILDPGQPTISFAFNYWHGPFGPYNVGTSVSQLAMSNLGKLVEIFGFKGSITDFGPTISDREAAWQAQGIFGSAVLHRNMAFLAYGGVGYLNSILTNQTFTNIFNRTTVTAKGAAGQLARLAGVGLTWYCADIAITNTFRYDGMSVLDVLATLAAQVGGTLRWDGSNSYIVAYPDQSFGLWEVPDPRLLTTNGLSYLQHLDLTTGIGGTGLITYPLANTNKNNLKLPDAAAGNGMPAVQHFGPQIRQKMTSEDPPVVFDLPYNYDRVFVQILVASDGDSSGSNLISIDNWITNDPTQWFEFNTSSLVGGLGTLTAYIFNTYIGETNIPQMKADYKMFPGGGADGINTSMDNGHFVMSFACSTKSLQSVFNSNQQSIQNQLKNNLAASFEQFRFIKTYSGSFSCQFFGTIPLPGMWGRATIPGGATVYSLDPATGDPLTAHIPDTTDMVVEGIIEHVQFSYPGTITVQVAQYARMNYGITNSFGVSVLSAGRPL